MLRREALNLSASGRIAWRGRRKSKKLLGPSGILLHFEIISFSYHMEDRMDNLRLLSKTDLLDEIYRTVSISGDLTPVTDEIVRRMRLLRPVGISDWQVIEDATVQAQLVFGLDSDMAHQSATLKKAGEIYAAIRTRLAERMGEDINTVTTTVTA